MWNEAMTALINPIGIPSTALPTVEEVVDSGGTNRAPTVGGSYYLCIDPAKFGSIADVKARSDAYVGAIEQCPPRPGHNVRVPGSTGYRFLEENAETVDVLTNHWEPFFVNIAGKYGLNEDKLRAEFAAT
jgi:LDH2 family malate/lactate/ureidoglycolate dehydrogenase